MKPSTGWVSLSRLLTRKTSPINTLDRVRERVWERTRLILFIYISGVEGELSVDGLFDVREPDSFNLGLVHINSRCGIDRKPVAEDLILSNRSFGLFLVKAGIELSGLQAAFH